MPNATFEGESLVVVILSSIHHEHNGQVGPDYMRTLRPRASVQGYIQRSKEGQHASSLLLIARHPRSRRSTGHLLDLQQQGAACSELALKYGIRRGRCALNKCYKRAGLVSALSYGTVQYA